MASVIPNPSAANLDAMHALYREGGADRMMAPHVVYQRGRLSSPRLPAGFAGDRFSVGSVRPRDSRSIGAGVVG